MPQKSQFQIDIPETDVLTWLFPSDLVASSENPDKPIYISATAPEKHSLSAAQVLQWVKRLAIGLRKLEGLGDGDVVMMFSPNHVYVPVMYLGVVAAKAIFCGCSVSFGVSGRLPYSILSIY